MEFLKSCSTNAQAIGEFDAVAYQAVSVTRNLTTAQTSFEWSPSDDIRAAEAELRQAQNLVVQDATRPWLWIFRSATVELPANTSPLRLPVVDGYQFHREQCGFMKASELARPPMRSASQNTPSTGSVSSPMTPGSTKPNPAGGGRLQQGNFPVGSTPDQQQQHDTFVVYELFTSAVVALIVYSLVKDHGAVALNYRTIISRATVQQDGGTVPHKLEHEYLSPNRLTNVDVFWASSGTLMVSTFTVPQTDMHCVFSVTGEEQKKILGKCIRLAPNGILAQIVSFEDPLETVVNDRNPKDRRKRPRTSPLEQGIERWKSTVKRWLAWKGYALKNLDHNSSWVRIRIAQPSPHASSSPALSHSSKEIMWPRALCFFYSTQTEDTYTPFAQGLASTRGDDGFKWFEALNSTGYTDPLDAAQRWFLGKPERDKIVEARRRAKKAEQDAVRSKDEVPNLLPSSPLNIRPGTYGDLQTASGVYPTPPDGILPGTVLSSADTPSVAGVGMNVILPPGGTNPAINLSAPQDIMQIDGQQQPPTSPDFTLSYDQYNTTGNHDDLFEDMEEDGFEANGVTDADFNFFDEPDDDVDMLDASNQEDTKQNAKKKAEQLKASTTSSDPTFESQSADPRSALESVLAAASKNNQVVQDTKPNAAIKTEESVDAKQITPPPRDSHTQITAAAPSVKENTPPLSPHFIEETLLPSVGTKPISKSHASTESHPRNSAFDPLDFNRKMSISDAKYQSGRFNFPLDKSQNRNKHEVEDASRKPKSLRDLPLVTKLRYAIGVAATKGLPDVPSPTDVDSDSSDDVSDDNSSVEDDVESSALFIPPFVPPGVAVPVKRKLPTEGNATPLSATSYADSFGGEYLEMLGLQTDDAALALLEPTLSDWSLVDVPAPVEIPSNQTRYSIPVFSPSNQSTPNTPVSPPDISMDMLDEKPLSGKDSIAVAQIVTAQVVSATLDILNEQQNRCLDDFTHHIPSESIWHEAIRAIFPAATNCNVTSFAAIQDVFPDLSQTKGQQRPPPRKPNEGPATLSHHMHHINPPHIRVRRSDVLWDLLPPALAFWEPLGLSPSSPPKNVVAFTVYPNSESLKLCVNNFMVNTQLAYDNCRLGSHTRVDTIPEYEGGLVPCKISNWTSTRAVFKALRDTCVQLGKQLSAKHAQMRGKEDTKIDAFVIYMIDPFENPSALWELCSAFWTLFQSYGQGPPGRHDQLPKPDLVLQVVPMKYVASFEAPVILDSSTYAGLAREVYDRCPPSAPCEDKTPLSIYTSPSFQLEEPIPRSVPFKLLAEPPHDLLHENSYIHLGYAISLDGMWVTAAWTDICGKFQSVVSYNLATRAFGDIAKEIWQTTIEILQARRVTWRVCIAKAGVMDREELEAWVFLVSCPTQINLFITLLTVDTEPHLKFTPTIPSSHPSATGGTNTPGSTPQGVVSPDHGLTPAATPSAENNTDPTTDPEARLVDATDETWGIILAHRLHNSNATNEFRPALISGLLVKRGLSPSYTITTTTSGPTNITSTSTSIPTAAPNSPDATVTPGPAIITVNILWMGAVNPTRAATSPFPPSTAAGTEGISPGGAGITNIVPPSPSPQERNYSSLTWTPTAQTRAAAENLLKEVLGQFRGLGLLARLKGIRGTRGGVVPWHVGVCLRGVGGLERVYPPGRA
ncbi:hypothetical protein DM02DRAFT_653184 [Periconia macrospinosa]|uniref:Mediator of RNA polymerase II transcription subunit 13 n=1 Tax=Periconia macrospinosa TaxID=97972 RepID=A0A2V1DXH3_9PLEO|nr:hypothetical protein DM02DRAFT_653184 [Periconia macrospinosa]